MCMAVMMSMKALTLLLFLLPLFSLSLLPGLTVSGQEAFEVMNLHRPSSSSSSSSSSQPPIPVPVAETDLPLLSASTTVAEGWVRTRVLPHLPFPNITGSILVGKGVLCARGREHHWGLVLPCALNLHYSLLKLGLLGRTRVAVSFSSDCLARPRHLYGSRFRHDLVEPTLRPLLGFLRDSHSIYSITPTPTPHLGHTTNSVVASHRTALEWLGFDVVGLKPKEAAERIARRLSSSDFVASSPYVYPEKPKPKQIGLVVAPAPAPAHAHAHAPADTSHFTPPPDSSPFSFGSSPEVVPGNSPDDPLNFGFPPLPPPCSTPAVRVAAPSPAGLDVEKGGLWCVAKPTVPPETLQEAIDYACGKGGADCEEIGPNGSCYYPDNAVAHASYAFNSYWQKTKRQGGSCGFGGTAILIASDPSYQHCRFVLN